MLTLVCAMMMTVPFDDVNCAGLGTKTLVIKTKGNVGLYDPNLSHKIEVQSDTDMAGPVYFNMEDYQKMWDEWEKEHLGQMMPDAIPHAVIEVDPNYMDWSKVRDYQILMDQATGQVMGASDSFVQDLAKTGAICRVFGHRWEDNGWSCSYNECDLLYRNLRPPGEIRWCSVCGRVEQREWKEAKP
jgi:hypothetical protein